MYLYTLVIDDSTTVYPCILYWSLRMFGTIFTHSIDDALDTISWLDNSVVYGQVCSFAKGSCLLMSLERVESRVVIHSFEM